MGKDIKSLGLELPYNIFIKDIEMGKSCIQEMSTNHKLKTNIMATVFEKLSQLYSSNKISIHIPVPVLNSRGSIMLYILFCTVIEGLGLNINITGKADGDSTSGVMILTFIEVEEPTQQEEVNA